MIWKLLKLLFRPSKEDKRLLEDIKNLPRCARVSKRGGLFKGAGCTKNNCRCGEEKQYYSDNPRTVLSYRMHKLLEVRGNAEKLYDGMISGREIIILLDSDGREYMIKLK